MTIKGNKMQDENTKRDWWTPTYTAIVILYGLYRQFIIPDELYNTTMYIWAGAVVWPLSLLGNIINFIFQTDLFSEYEIIKAIFDK